MLYWKTALKQLGIKYSVHSVPLLFSPFQTLSISTIDEIFPNSSTSYKEPSVSQKFANEPIQKKHDTTNVIAKLDRKKSCDETHDDQQLISLKNTFNNLYVAFGSVERAASEFAESRNTDKQITFYPLVCNLIQLLGIQATLSPPGVNYRRWDACFELNNIVVPIEIKSPTEETLISTKAIRQALENKIVLLSRNELHTTFDSTTLIIGYKYPTERSDLSRLIEGVFDVYGIRVGVVDLYTLTLLAMKQELESLTLDSAQLIDLCGFLHVDSCTA